MRVVTVIAVQTILVAGNLAVVAGTPGAPPAAELSETDLSRADLREADLTGSRFAGPNLSGASFAVASLTGADFTDAQVSGADFWRTTSLGFSAKKRYSTASYRNKDLVNIGLSGQNLTGWDLSGKNLTGASFTAATLVDVNLSLADLRGATGISLEQAFGRQNTILPDGTIAPLDLRQVERLVVRDGGLPITVNEPECAALLGVGMLGTVCGWHGRR